MMIFPALEKESMVYKKNDKKEVFVPRNSKPKT
jgi:hypothetical protein